jgi:hypothetical protein
LQGGVYALLTGQATGRDVSRIEFVFAAAGETRTITDIDGVVAEVRSALSTAFVDAPRHRGRSDDQPVLGRGNRAQLTDIGGD